jgi:hypothetical protein
MPRQRECRPGSALGTGGSGSHSDFGSAGKAKYYIHLWSGTTDKNMLGLQRRNCAYSIVADDPVLQGRIAMGTRGISRYADSWRAGVLAGGFGGG